MARNYPKLSYSTSPDVPFYVNKALDAIERDVTSVEARADSAGSTAAKAQAAGAAAQATATAALNVSRDALTSSSNAASNAMSARTIAAAAQQTSSTALDLITATAAGTGLGPSTPEDGQTAAYLAQPDTLTRAAFGTALTARIGRTIYADQWYDATASDHRPAIQAALDAATAGDTVVFGAGRTWLLGSKTQPYTATTAQGLTNAAYDPRSIPTWDRVLVKKPDVNIRLEPGARWQVTPALGRYGTILGNARPTDYETSCVVDGLHVDHNTRAAAGLRMRFEDQETWVMSTIRLVSYARGGRITLRSVKAEDSDSTNCFYIAAHHLTFENMQTIGAGLNSTAWHDHSTIYALCTLPGGTQTWVGGAFTGGGMSSVCPVEIHGGIVSMTPFSVDGYMVAMNAVGSPGTTGVGDVPLRLVCQGVNATGVAFGVQLWSWKSAGRVESADVTLTVTVDRDRWWPYRNAHFEIGGHGLNIEHNSDAPIRSLRIRGTIDYLPTKNASPADWNSNGLHLHTDGGACVVENADVDVQVLRPYTAGVYLGTPIRQGVLRVRTVDPGASPGTTGVVDTSTGVVIGAAELSHLRIDSTVIDTRATPKAASAAFASGAFTTGRDVDLTASLSYPAGKTTPMAWYPIAGVKGVEGVRAMSESHTVWPGNWATQRGGSRFHNPSTGQTMTQTTYPAGSTWVSA